MYRFFTLAILFAFVFAREHHKDRCLIEPECQIISQSCINDASLECTSTKDCLDQAACVTKRRCNTNRAACENHNDCPPVNIECAADCDCPPMRCVGLGTCSHRTQQICSLDSDCTSGEVCLRLNGTCARSHRRCYKDSDCPSYGCDTKSERLSLGNPNNYTTNIFLIIWAIIATVLCIIFLTYKLCTCRQRRHRSSDKQSEGDDAADDENTTPRPRQQSSIVVGGKRRHKHTRHHDV